MSRPFPDRDNDPHYDQVDEENARAAREDAESLDPPIRDVAFPIVVPPSPRAAALEGGPGPFSFTVTVPGEPVAQGRGKVGRWKSKDGREGVTVRDPAKSRSWKAFAMDRFEQALDAAGRQVPLAGAGEPVRLIITATFGCPKGDHRKLPVPARPHTKRGDGDNIWKAVADAGTGVLWHDDAQIFDGRVVKRIGAQGEAARVELVVELPYRAPALSARARASLQRTLLEAGAE